MLTDSPAHIVSPDALLSIAITGASTTVITSVTTVEVQPPELTILNSTVAPLAIEPAAAL